MAKKTFKEGDVVQLNEGNYSSTWKSSYNLKLGVRYKIAKVVSDHYSYSIQAVDPKDAITYEGKTGKGSIEVDIGHINLDEDFIKEKLEKLFG